MKKEIRTAIYNQTLQIEACRFAGVHQPFPNHFHDYYVIGLVEEGQRELCCKAARRSIGPGDLLLFNPGDNHGCTQLGPDLLDYRSLQIGRPAMRMLCEAATGEQILPTFAVSVLQDETAACYLRSVHEMLNTHADAMELEETVLLLLGHLIAHYSQPVMGTLPPCRSEVMCACAFLQQHLGEHLDLAQICHVTGLSKSTLLRAFTQETGLTPYRYLESLRIDEAKRLLKQGIVPAEVALQTGFSDQSHFTHYFRRFLGLSPGQYRDIFFHSHPTGGITHAL